MSCKASSIGKAGQLAINKHVDNSKKAARTGERIFSDVATIKALQDSGIIITNRNWHIGVDQHTGYNKPEFYSAKSNLVELTCKKFSKWRNNGKPVSYIRHNNALENKGLIKISNASQWKLDIITEYAGKGTPQRS